MGKRRFPPRKYGGDRRAWKPVAHTSQDQRYNLAGKINVSMETCLKKQLIQATQKNGIVWIVCGCGHAIGVSHRDCFGSEIEAIEKFMSSHPV